MENRGFPTHGQRPVWAFGPWGLAICTGRLILENPAFAKLFNDPVSGSGG